MDDSIQEKETCVPQTDDKMNKIGKQLRRSLSPKEGEMEEATDWSKLPDVAWVNIMSYLSLPEKSIVSQTCQSLCRIFSHPSLWHTVEIVLLGDADRYGEGGIMLPGQYLRMIQTYGAYFQDLILIFDGYLHRMPAECEEVVTALCHTCRLERLTLEVNSLISMRDLQFHHSRKTDVDVLIGIVTNAFRLRIFNLRAWPSYPGIQFVDILGALQSNAKIQNLEKLSLYWLEAAKTTWATLNAVLPSPEELTQTVNHFKYLRCLKLRSTMLNENVILAFANKQRVPLESLAILVTYYHKTRSGIPDISPQAWLKLRSFSPALTVEITIVTRIPPIQMADLLKPEMPLSSIGYMKYARAHPDDIVTIAELYNSTLTKFVDYTDSYEHESAIWFLVNKCQKLNYFVFCGHITRAAVSSLAATRGKIWSYFQVNIDNVITKVIPSGDDDVIIRQTEDGEYHVVGWDRPVETDEEREAILAGLIEEVAISLGQKWKPLNSAALDSLDQSPFQKAKVRRMPSGLAGR